MNEQSHIRHDCISRNALASGSRSEQRLEMGASALRLIELCWSDSFLKRSPSLALRVSVICLLLSMLLTSHAVAADPGARERTFVRALEVFDSAKSPDDYCESAKLLESILADGFRSGAVYYNLGNAYFRSGEFGRVILAYRKAKQYRPRDPYLTANLRQALAAAPGRLSEPPRPWWSHVLFWIDWLSFPMKVQTCFFTLTLPAVITSLRSQ